MELASVIKYEGDNSTFVWKHPKENFNTNSQLIVNESQEALLFKDGQAQDLFSKAGKYTLKTKNIPILGKLLSLPFDGETPFQCAVYFINKTEQPDVPWGKGGIPYHDPTLGDHEFTIRANGRMSVQVQDAKKLIVKLVGTERVFDQSNFQSKLQTALAQTIHTVLPRYLRNNKTPIAKVDQDLIEISNALLPYLQEELDQYGLIAHRVWIENIDKPINDPVYQEVQRQITRGALKHLDSAARAEEAKAEVIAQEAEAAAEAQIRKAKAEAERDARKVEISVEKELTEEQGKLDELKAAIAKRIALIEYQGVIQQKAMDKNLELDVARREIDLHVREMQKLGITELQSRAVKVLETAAANPGSGNVSGPLMGLGMGMGLGGTMGDWMKDLTHLVSASSPKAGESGSFPDLGDIQLADDVADIPDIPIPDAPNVPSTDLKKSEVEPAVSPDISNSQPAKALSVAEAMKQIAEMVETMKAAGFPEDEIAAARSAAFNEIIGK